MDADPSGSAQLGLAEDPGSTFPGGPFYSHAARGVPTSNADSLRLIAEAEDAHGEAVASPAPVEAREPLTVDPRITTGGESAFAERASASARKISSVNEHGFARLGVGQA